MKRILDFFFACNAAQPLSDEGEWHCLSPWGRFPHALGLQDVSAEAVAPMVAAFNQQKAKGGPRWPGLPVYEWHPDAPAAAKFGWNNKKPIGRVLDLEIRADGIYSRVAWNEDGERNRANRQLPYPSPAWYLAKQADGTQRPVKLKSVGMVEDPNIPGSVAWNASTAEEDSETDESPEPPTHESMELTKELAALLGLKDDGSPEDIVSAVRAMKDSAATKATESETAMNSLKEACNAATQGQEAAANDLAAARTALAEAEQTMAGLKLAVNGCIEHTVALAVNGGVIARADAPAWKEKLAANAATAAAELAGLKPAYNTARLGGMNREQAYQKQLAANEAHAALATKIAEAMPKHRNNHAAAYNAVVSDPENAALVLAANGTQA